VNGGSICYCLARLVVGTTSIGNRLRNSLNRKFLSFQSGRNAWMKRRLKVIDGLILALYRGKICNKPWKRTLR